MSSKMKFKVIFKDEKKKDGTTFKKMLTILKVNGENKWCQIKFGDLVNTKAWKNHHQIVCAEQKEMSDGSKNIRIPDSFEPFMYKGKMRYPYVYIQEIIGSIDYTPKEQPRKEVEATQDSFSMDDVDEKLPW